MYKLEFKETIKIRNTLTVKRKNKSNKVNYILKSGASFFKKTKTWHSLNRVIDKVNDVYKELILDSSGKVIKNVKMKLTQHQGHGSAKYKKIKVKK
jgi:UDP-N-acetylenolpyruvoylglucosamine reductase